MAAYGATEGLPNKFSAASAFPTAVNSPESVRQDEERGTLLVSVKQAGENRGEHEIDRSGSGIFGKGARRTDNSRIVTTLLVLNYMIGSGILNTSQTALRSGLAATTVLYVIACLAIWVGGVVLILAAEASSAGTLEDLEYAALAHRTLGKHGPALVDGSIVVTNFGAVCSYVILVGGLTSSLLTEWTSTPGTDAEHVLVAWWESFYFVTPLMVLLLVLPPCLVRHFSNLRWLSAFSLFAIAMVVFLVVLGSPYYAAAERESIQGETALDDPIVWWNWTGAFSKLGSVVFALSCAPAALHSYSAMGKRNESEWKAVMGSSVIYGGILCYGTGLLGYLAFRGTTEGDILDNFSGPLAACFKILVVLHLVMYIPNEVVILRHSLFDLAGRDVMEAGFSIVSSVTIGVLGLIVGVVTSLMMAGVAEGDLFGYILDLTGGVTASLTSFVLPSLAYLNATKGTPSSINSSNIGLYRVACRALLVFGLLVMVLVPTAVVISALNSGA